MQKPLAFLIALLISSTLLGQDAKPRKKPAKTGRPPSVTWVNEPDAKTLPLPPRTRHLTFHSKLVDQDVGYCVYLPAKYDAAPAQRFPVIYNLHGNGGNEFKGLFDIQVLHEAITSGRIPPVIMVLPNGGHSTFYKDSADGKFPIESILMKEFIPHIDETYRTIANGTGRCIEGFSMGGRGSTRLAIKYPEMFCSLFCQAGNVPDLLAGLEAGDVNSHPINYLGTDRSVYEANDVYHLIKQNRKRIVNGLRIQIACGTKDGGHLPTVRAFHQALLDAKIDHTYIEIEGLAHKRTEMINLYRPIWFNYHIESLRRSGALPRERKTPATHGSLQDKSTTN